MTHTETLSIDEFDVDGVIAEREHEAIEASGSTRADFLKKFAVGAGGVAIATSLVAPGTASAAGSAANDLKILNYALTLEFLEAAFYREAVASRGVTGVNNRFAKVVYEHEFAHVKALTDTIKKLGGTPVASPKFNFRGSNKSNGVFQQTALALEETGVAAYIGQAAAVFNPAVLTAAARIATVEARHAAWMHTILGSNPAPFAFDPQRTMAGTLKVVTSTKFIV